MLLINAVNAAGRPVELFVKDGKIAAVGQDLSALAGYDSVEYQAIIETLVRKAYEVFYCVGRGLPVHLQLYPASAFHFDYYHTISFSFLLFCIISQTYSIVMAIAP